MPDPMRLRSAILIIGLAFSAALPVAAASATDTRPPVYGAADGVTLTHSGDAVALHLTGAAAVAGAPYAGQTLTLACDDHAPVQLLLADQASEGGSSADGTLRRAADGTLTLTTRLAELRDVCSLKRPFHERTIGHRGAFTVETDAPPPLARVAVTPAGTTWLDELASVTRLLDATAAAQVLPYPAAVAGVPALPGPGATPPVGDVGYWSDGARHAAFVTTSSTGRRLLFEDLGDRMQRSNINAFINDYVPPGGGRTYLLTSVSDHDAGRAAVKLPAASVRDKGVRSSLSGRELTVRFTGRSAATFRALAGRKVTVSCNPTEAAAGEDRGLGFIDGVQRAVVRMPRHGGLLRVRLRTASAVDVCQIEDDGRSVATLTPTLAARRTLQDLKAVTRIFSASEVLSSLHAKIYPSASSLASRDRRLLVVLPRPGAPVPAGRVGIWTDGAQHALLATTSSTGRRLIFADEGNGVVRSNVLWLASVAFFGAGSSGGLEE
jgi:hypothetical protein